jgi:hypothetical protein
VLLDVVFLLLILLLVLVLVLVFLLLIPLSTFPYPVSRIPYPVSPLLAPFDIGPHYRHPFTPFLPSPSNYFFVNSLHRYTIYILTSPRYIISSEPQDINHINHLPPPRYISRLPARQAILSTITVYPALFLLRITPHVQGFMGMT